MSVDNIFSDEQLVALKSLYVNSITSSLSVNQLLQLAGKTLLANYSELGGYDLKDRIISETNLQTWESLVEQLKKLEENIEKKVDEALS